MINNAQDLLIRQVWNIIYQNTTSGRMAIVLATFILAAQEILDLLYLALLFMSDQTELNSLVAKNACYAPQGISHSSSCWRAWSSFY